MVNEPTSAFPEVPGGSSGSGDWVPPGGQPPAGPPEARAWDPTPSDDPPPESAPLNGLGGPPADAEPPRSLTGWLPMALGILLIFLGALWTLQGMDVLSGSKMSGASIWSVVGPIVALAGLILIVLGVRRRSRAKRHSTTP
jgi:hypothetical protein